MAVAPLTLALSPLRGEGNEAAGRRAISVTVVAFSSVARKKILRLCDFLAEAEGAEDKKADAHA